MSDRVFRIVIRAQNDADKAFGEVSRSLNRLGIDFDVVNRGAREGADGFSRFDRTLRTATEGGFTRAQARLVSLEATLSLLSRAASAAQRAFESTFGGFAQDAIELNNLANRMGAPVEELSKLQIVAKETELDVATLAPALKKVTDAVAQAQDPASKFGKFFAEGLKLSREELERLNKATPTERLLTLIEAFRGIENSAIKTRAELQVFGSRSVDAVRQLDASVADLRKRYKELENDPAVIGDKDVRGALAFDQALDDLKRTLVGLRNELGRSGALGEITLLVNQFREALSRPEALEAVRAIGREVKEFAAGAAEAFPRVVESFGQLFTLLQEGIRLWIAYKAAVISAAAVQVTIAALSRLVAAIQAVSAALAAARTQQVLFGTAAAATTALGVGVTALGGPVTILAGVLGVAAAAATYFGSRSLLARDNVRALKEELSDAAPVAEDFADRVEEAYTRQEQAKRLRDQRQAGLTPESARARQLFFEIQKGIPTPRVLATDFFGDAGKKTDEFATKLAALKARLAEVTGTASPLEAKVAEILKDFDGFKGKDATVRPIAEELARATLAAEDFKQEVALALAAMQEPTARNVQLLREFRAGLEAAPQTAEVRQAIDAITKQVENMNRAVSKTSADTQKELVRAIEEARDPTAVLRHELDDAAEAGTKLGNVNLVPLTAELQRARKEAAGMISLLGSAKSIGKDFWDSVVIGGRDFGEFAKTVPAAIGRVFSDGFFQALDAKTDFDQKFKVNIFDLVKNAGEVVTGRRGIGQIFSGAFQTAAKSMAVLPSAAEEAAQQSSEALHTLGTDAVDAAQAVSDAGTQAAGGWGGFFDFILKAGQSVFGTLTGLAQNLLGVLAGVVGLVSGGGTGSAVATVGGALQTAGAAVNRSGGSGILGSISSAVSSLPVLGKLVGFVGGLGNFLSALGGVAGLFGGALTLFQGKGAVAKLSGLVQFFSGLQSIGGLAFGGTSAGIGLAGSIAQTGNPLLIGTANLFGAGIQGPGFSAIIGKIVTAVLAKLGIGTAATTAGTAAATGVATAGSAASSVLSTVATVAPYIAAAIGAYLAISSEVDVRSDDAPKRAQQFQYTTAPTNFFRARETGSIQGQLGNAIDPALTGIISLIGNLAGADIFGMGATEEEWRKFLRTEFSKRLGEVLGRPVSAAGGRLGGALRGTPAAGALDILGNAAVPSLGNEGLRRPDFERDLRKILAGALGGGDLDRFQRGARSVITAFFGSVIGLFRSFNQNIARAREEGQRPLSRRQLDRQEDGVRLLGNLFTVAGVRVGDVFAKHIAENGRVQIAAALPELRTAILKSAQEGNTIVARDARRLGDPFLAVVAKLQKVVPREIDLLGIAIALATNGVKRSSAELTRTLGRAVSLQTTLFRRGLPQLSESDLDAFVSDRRGDRAQREQRAATAAVVGLQTIQQFFNQSTLQARGFGPLAAGLQADNRVQRVFADLTDVFEKLAERERNLRQAIAAGNVERAKNIRERIRQDQENIPQIAQQAIEAVQQWGESVLGLVEKIRQARQEMEDFAIATGETIDGLTGATGTAKRYAFALATANDRLNKATTAVGKLAAINRIMDLLQRQAAAAIQDVQDAAEAEKRPLRLRLEAIDKELAALSKLASLATQLDDQISAIELSAEGGSGGGLEKLAFLQNKLAEQQAAFRAATTDDERAAAAEEISRLVAERERVAGEFFGVNSAEFQSIQQEDLGVLKEVQAFAKTAAERQEALLEEQTGLQTQIRDIDERTADAVEVIQETLAAQLEFWSTRAIPLLAQQEASLREQLRQQFPGLTEEQLEQIINDPGAAQLAVQQAMRDKLGDIYALLKYAAEHGGSVAGFVPPSQQTPVQPGGAPPPPAAPPREPPAPETSAEVQRKLGVVPETFQAAAAGDTGAIASVLGSIRTVMQRYIDQLRSPLGTSPQAARTIGSQFETFIPAIAAALTSLRLNAGQTLSFLQEFRNDVAAGMNATVLSADLEAALNALPARAKGGPVTAQKTYLVGEKGPELYASTVPARVAGGAVAARSAYLVGTHGPELFKPAESGHVLPAHTTATVMARAAGGPVAAAALRVLGGPALPGAAVPIALSSLPGRVAGGPVVAGPVLVPEAAVRLARAAGGPVTAVLAAPPLTVHVDMPARAMGGSVALPAREKGGPVSGVYLVGERGPELYLPRAIGGSVQPMLVGLEGPQLFAPAADGRIVEHHQSMTMLQHPERVPELAALARAYGGPVVAPLPPIPARETGGPVLATPRLAPERRDYAASPKAAASGSSGGGDSIVVNVGGITVQAYPGMTAEDARHIGRYAADAAEQRMIDNWQRGRIARRRQRASFDNGAPHR